MKPGRTAFLLVGWLFLVVTGCPATRPDGKVLQPPDPLDTIAESYVKLALQTGRHDADYVDAYYGPPAWKQAAQEGEPVPVAQLLDRAQKLRGEIGKIGPSARRNHLAKQVIALEAFLQKLNGKKMSLDEEARLLYDITPSRHDLEYFEKARKQIEDLLPGEGTLAERAERFRKRFEIPAAKMDAVVKLIMEDIHERTLALCDLPEGEECRTELVTGKPWGGYHWYQGNLKSLVQLNTDLPTGLPIQVSRLSHEAYPGHHTYLSLLEDRLVRGKGWIEYTVYPLHSPLSLISEGAANVAIDILYSEEELLHFLRDVLAPVAGLDGRDFEKYLQLRKALRHLRYTGVEATYMLIEEGKPENEVVDFLIEYALYNPKRAKQSLAFIRRYRTYVFNYTAGENLVRSWLGEGEDRNRRFFELLQRPVTPADLVPATSSTKGRE